VKLPGIDMKYEVIYSDAYVIHCDNAELFSDSSFTFSIDRTFNIERFK